MIYSGIMNRDKTSVNEGMFPSFLYWWGLYVTIGMLV